MIRYSRACGSYQDLLDIGLMLTRMLLNQGFLLVDRYGISVIKVEQKTHWPKEKIQKNKQRSTKHTHKTKDRVTRTLLKTGGEKTY
jgi:hypothetical protein